MVHFHSPGEVNGRRNRSSLQRTTSDYPNSLSGTTAVSNGGKTTAPVAGPIIRYERN